MLPPKRYMHYFSYHAGMVVTFGVPSTDSPDVVTSDVVSFLTKTCSEAYIPCTGVVLNRYLGNSTLHIAYAFMLKYDSNNGWTGAVRAAKISSLTGDSFTESTLYQNGAYHLSSGYVEWLQSIEI